MIRHLPTGWTDTIVVCGKCSRKLDGGFGAKGRQPLAKALRKRLGLGRGRKAAVGVVETKCLGVCPKRAVVVGRAGGWLVVPAGTSVECVAAELALGRSAELDDGGGD